MISILDYGLGNLGSVLNMLRHIKIPAKLISTPDEIINSDSILLPGVGAFDAGMQNLKNRGFIEPLHDAAINKKMPILGICLGAQLLMQDSEEGVESGLGWIPGKVCHFSKLLKDKSSVFRVPHMGWAAVESDSDFFQDMDEDRRYYFVHSYYLNPEKDENALCTANYGERFVAGVKKANITGVQFHPEKSHQYGMQFFRNYYGATSKP